MDLDGSGGALRADLQRKGCQRTTSPSMNLAESLGREREGGREIQRERGGRETERERDAERGREREGEIQMERGGEIQRDG